MKTFSAALTRLLPALLSALLLSSCAQMLGPTSGVAASTPAFQVDPLWPQPLPERAGVQQLFGQVAGIAVDPRNGHIWAIHRPASLLPDEFDPKTNKPVTHRCCVAMPPVAEFDAAGKLLRAWSPQGAGFDWPKVEHGIYIDDEGSVWLAGNAVGDNQILKFTQDGKFLMQVGRAGPTEGSNSTKQLGQPANMMVSKGELFVADGYGNKRVIVFDAATGAYKRHWGAYGGRPSDDKLPAYDPAQPPSRQFSNPVHCVRMSREDLLYVCDRTNNRIQVFTRAGEFKQEFRVEPMTVSNGSVWDMVLSQDPAQKYMYVADGANGRIYILRRSDGQQVGQFGRTGRMAGEFKWIHNLAIDADGNLYTSEVGFGRRVQKFVRSGGF
ncbi:MAG: repeat protein [Ramlibacter sp.]|nr:repeat protein [Ramlibacter sp.]